MPLALIAVAFAVIAAAALYFERIAFALVCLIVAFVVLLLAAARANRRRGGPAIGFGGATKTRERSLCTDDNGPTYDTGRTYYESDDQRYLVSGRNGADEAREAHDHGCERSEDSGGDRDGEGAIVCDNDNDSGNSGDSSSD